MYRGTTPTLKFALPFDASLIAAGNVSIAQNGNVIIDRAKRDWVISGREVKITLAQQETLQLQPNTNVEIQMRIRLADGTALASKIFSLTAERVLKDGEI